MARQGSGRGGSFNPKDSWFHKAKKEGFAARSVFKLEEIDKRFRILKSGDHVMDLGAAPGSWSQYCSSKIGSQGKLLGIDLTEINIKLPNAVFIQGDLREVDVPKLLAEIGMRDSLDLVISDMAPKTTGIKSTDQARSLELCELALTMADRFLRRDGNFVCKFFHSADFDVLRGQIKERFRKVESVKPDSTRKESKEIFLIGLGKLV